MKLDSVTKVMPLDRTQKIRTQQPFQDKLNMMLQEQEQKSQNEKAETKKEPISESYQYYLKKQKDRMEKDEEEEEEEKSHADIVVEADGSKTLVITTLVGGMESTVRIKISEPTDLISESNRPGADQKILNDMENKTGI